MASGHTDGAEKRWKTGSWPPARTRPRSPMVSGWPAISRGSDCRWSSWSRWEQAFYPVLDVGGLCRDRGGNHGTAKPASGWAGSGGGDAEDLRVAERDVGVEGQLLARDQGQAGVAAGQLGHGDLGLQAAQVRPQAE